MSAWLTRLSLAALIVCLSCPTHAEPSRRDDGEAPLLLEVYRNGEPTGLIAAFERTPDGRLSTATSELRALGLVPPAGSDRVALDGLPGVTYRYDDAGQRLFLQADPTALVPLQVSFAAPARRATPSADVGALINYSLSTRAGLHGIRREQAVAGSAEGRVFGPFGLVVASGTAAAGGVSDSLVRLDTAWVKAFPAAAVTVTTGDLISGGLSWSRPVRLGGLQVRRDFATRPDLVTMPLHTLSATAAAPSTLEVMLGSNVLLSRPITAGPVQISDLPAVQGAGRASLVLRDASGALQQVVASYFSTPELIRGGLLDYSLEVGLPRRSFGYRSNDYASTVAASASVRYGLTDRLTLQGHAEGGAGLVNGGLGAVAPLAGLGAVSAAAAFSHDHGQDGALLAGTFQAQIGPTALSATAQRAFGHYRDLGAVTARRGPYGADPDAAPPRSLLQFALSSPLRLPFVSRWADEAPSVSLSYARVVRDQRESQALWTGAMRYAVTRSVSLQGSAFRSGGRRGQTGAFLSINVQLSGDRTMSAGGNADSGGRAGAFAEIRRQERLEPGAVGWRLRADAGQMQRVEAEAVYRSPIGRLAARVAEAGGAGVAEARMDGALVVMGRPMLAPDRIDAAFAVVDAGAPDVTVRRQSRAVGVTGDDGRLLVTNLNPYESNVLSIDLDGLGLDLAASDPQQVISPPYGAGARVRFGVAKAPPQLSIILHLAGGDFVPPGAVARLHAGGRPAIVGYDGIAFIEDVSAENSLQVDLGDGAACTARFHVDLSNGGPLDAQHAVCS